MSLCLKRKSIRAFKSTPINDDMITKLLKSAMQAPTAINQQPWEFIVVKNRELLDDLSTISNGARHLKKAPLAIIPLFHEDAKAAHMAPFDVAAATQNILLEATNQGLGSLWIGVYPLTERVARIKTKIRMPSYLTPFSIIAIGEPDESMVVETFRYDPSKVRTIE